MKEVGFKKKRPLSCSMSMLPVILVISCKFDRILEIIEVIWNGKNWVNPLMPGGNKKVTHT